MFDNLNPKYIGPGPNQVNPALIHYPTNLFGECPITLENVEKLENPVITLPYGQREFAIHPDYREPKDIETFNNITLTSTCIYEQKELDKYLRDYSSETYRAIDIANDFVFPPDTQAKIDSQLSQLEAGIKSCTRISRKIALIPCACSPLLAAGILLVVFTNPTSRLHAAGIIMCFMLPAMCTYFAVLAYCDARKDIRKDKKERKEVLQIPVVDNCPIYIPIDRDWIRETQIRLKQYQTEPQYTAEAIKIQRCFRNYQARKSPPIMPSAHPLSGKEEF